MKTLKSYVNGAWHTASDGFVDLYDPATEEVVGRASSAGIDFGAAVEYARTKGGEALRKMTFAERGALLKGMSKILFEHREELIDLSLLSTGATRKDAKFDLDGATGTISYYAGLGKQLGDARWLVDGDGTQLGRTARFWGEHVRLPRRGVAVHINAFNFPAWGFAEKAAASILAGMPVITKPATSTAMVCERCVEIIVEAGILPDGVLSMICGSTGDLLDRLRGQDVMAFTGSADTGLKLRSRESIMEHNVRVNVEADSLNAAVLGPDVEDDSETYGLFLRDVAREITQKSGQKCTAVRRVFVPESRIDQVLEDLGERVGEAVVGDPRHDGVTLGPLATAQQLTDAVAGVAKLSEHADLVHGTGQRVDGQGADAGKGYFFAPCVLRARDAEAEVLHSHEVFGPVTTVFAYDGSAPSASDLIGRGGGSLVSSVYSNDVDFVRGMIEGSSAWNGRLYLGSEKMAEQAPGSGVALPMCLHGGPGRAGGGEELGGLRALEFYMQRTSLQGDRPTLEKLMGK